MHPADRTYRNQTVRLADLTVISDMIENVTFENCIIEGPAVVVALGANGSMVNCGFEGRSTRFSGSFQMNVTTLSAPSRSSIAPWSGAIYEGSGWPSQGPARKQCAQRSADVDTRF